MTKKKSIQTCGGLVEFLQATQTASWKRYHNNRTCYESYEDIRRNLNSIQDTVIVGAMEEGIETALKGYEKRLEECLPTANQTDSIQKIHEVFAEDPIIFLNDHGKEHVEMVIDRANLIVMHFQGNNLSEFEVFLLLCAIEIHDIGNILGRSGHEKKFKDLFDNYSKNIILDAPERRVIKSIAMAHGGKNTSGGKDTISTLSASEAIFGNTVRTRLLASILRFADELADDSTRANRAALDLNLLRTNSEIYHKYSRALHSVTIDGDVENRDCKVCLVYELETDLLKEKFQVGGFDKYLLDEIYDRTLKMEKERRYCMKFMHPHINIGRIDVKINIYGQTTEKVRTISYILEDVSYPELPVAGQINTLWEQDVPTGEELLNSLIKGGVMS